MSEGDFSFGAGITDDDSYVPENTAGGLEDESEGTRWDKAAGDEMAYYESLMQRIESARTEVYGQNAAERWKGTPAVGFAGASNRQPIFGLTGRYGREGQPEVRQRIDGSTHWASPPQGLVGGMVAEGRSIQFKSPQDRAGLQSLPYQRPQVSKPAGLATAVGNYGTQWGRTGTAGTEIHSPYGTASLKAPPLSPIPHQAMVGGSLDWTPKPDPGYAY